MRRKTVEKTILNHVIMSIWYLYSYEVLLEIIGAIFGAFLRKDLQAGNGRN